MRKKKFLIHKISLVVIFLFLLVSFLLIVILLHEALDKIKSNLRRINIKNHYTCYYFDNIIKIEDFDFDDCLRKRVFGKSNDGETKWIYFLLKMTNC